MTRSLLLVAAGLAGALAGEFDSFAGRVAEALSPVITSGAGPVVVVIPPPQAKPGSPPSARIAGAADAVQQSLRDRFASEWAEQRLKIAARPDFDPYGANDVLIKKGTDLSGLAMRSAGGAATATVSREVIISITYATVQASTVSVSADIKAPDGNRLQITTQMTVDVVAAPAQPIGTQADAGQAADWAGLLNGLPARTLSVSLVLGRYQPQYQPGLIDPLLRNILADGEAIEFHALAEAQAEALVLGLYAHKTWKFILPSVDSDTRITSESRRIAASRISAPFGPEQRLMIACTDRSALARLAVDLCAVPGNINADEHVPLMATWLRERLGGQPNAARGDKKADPGIAARLNALLVHATRGDVPLSVQGQSAPPRPNPSAVRWGWVSVPIETVP
ncbi:hypothetical protein LBMAG53_38130 [Planctomycetota bacterium]|nr:hypothetical protein LBMAG53_38130 [Planctomycetota bacterium]